MTSTDAAQLLRPKLSIPGAVSRGLAGLWRCRGMLFPIYLANLLTAVFALLPFYLALHRLTAHRPVAERLTHAWDLEVLAELVMDNPDLVAQLKGLFVFVPIGYLLVNQLLIGGVLGALARLERPSPRSFGGDALSHFTGLLWVLLCSALPYALAGGALGLGVMLATDSSWPVKLLCALPGMLLLCFVDAALDFARVETVTGPGRWAVKRLLYGFWAVLKRPLAAAAIHVGFGLLWLIPLAVWLVLPDSLDAGGSAAVLLAFLLRQIVVLLRVAIRVGSLGSHMALYFAIFEGSSLRSEPDSAQP
ncbi:MAG: hypothetical protein ABI333_27480 [bacterium]